MGIMQRFLTDKNNNFWKEMKEAEQYSVIFFLKLGCSLILVILLLSFPRR
jgi:predicted membrane channel-forming protein YqfA (hemolysin III family)